jgi:alpha-tubulin suppressor-like RCC1 family protein
VQPSDVIAGAPIAPAVKIAILDASGNVVTTATDSIYTNFTVSYGGTPSGTFRQKAVNGVATFNDLSINKAHTDYRLQTLSIDRDLGVVTSNTFTVSVGPPDRLAFVVQPRDIMAEVVFDSALQVVVQDNQGNTVSTSTASVAVAITSGTGAAGATLSGATTQSASAGLASFGDLSIDSAGTGYTLTATSAGLSSDTTVPFRIVGPLYATQVSAAHYVFNCALIAGGGGAAYCWGYNGNGQLGDGTTTGTRAPVAVAGGLTFSVLTGGGLHGCGVIPGGAAYCWGLGLYGELGNGSTAESHTPSPVSDGHTFASVSGGVYHTCGVTTTGAAYCWGDGAASVLGDSTYGGSTTPRLVAGGHTWTNVSAGYVHSCGVTTTAEGYCWGDGSRGDLGNGSTSTPLVPVLVSGGLTFATMAAGGTEDSCGLTTSGAAYCWGWNGYGQLGDGSTSLLSTTPVPVAGGLTFTSISAGDAHYCALTAGGAMYCWGLNRFGQLGDGTTTDRNAPVAVSGGLTFSAVSAGRDHTCGLATSGIVYCWGYNEGTLGDRTLTHRSVPVRVSAP